MYSYLQPTLCDWMWHLGYAWAQTEEQLNTRDTLTYSSPVWHEMLTDDLLLPLIVFVVRVDLIS